MLQISTGKCACHHYYHTLPVTRQRRNSYRVLKSWNHSWSLEIIWKCTFQTPPHMTDHDSFQFNIPTNYTYKQCALRKIYSLSNLSQPNLCSQNDKFKLSDHTRAKRMFERMYSLLCLWWKEEWGGKVSSTKFSLSLSRGSEGMVD